MFGWLKLKKKNEEKTRKILNYVVTNIWTLILTH